MEIYQHDGATTFRFELRGRLEGWWVEELEHAWRCATSVLKGKKLVVEISKLTGADKRGIDLLSRMQESGAQFCAAASPEHPELARRFGAAPPASRVARWPTLRSRVSRLIGRFLPRTRPSVG